MAPSVQEDPAAPAGPNPQTLTRSFAGLYSQHNRLNQVPDGACVIADNVVGDREGICEPRRGFNFFGPALSSIVSFIREYKGLVLIRDGSTMKYASDSVGTAWNAWAGSFDPPTGEVEMQTIEQLESLYFTSSTGIIVQDSLTGTPRRSGIPRGLDINITQSGTGASGILAVDSAFAYVVIWLRRDANKVEKRGEQSRPEQATNALVSVTWTKAGTTVTVTQNGHGYSNGDTVQIRNSSDVAALPNGAHIIGGVAANTYTITVAAGGGSPGTASAGKNLNTSVNFTIPGDNLAGDFWELYRTPSALTAGTPVGGDFFLVARNEVSVAEKAAGVITYADTRSDSLLGEPAYINETQETSTLANGRPPYAEHIAEWKGHVWMLNTYQPHALTLQLLDVAGLVDGTSAITFTIGGATLTYTFAAAENIGARQFQRVTTFPTLAQNLEATMKSLEKVVNRDTGNTFFTASYLSGEEDAPGQILFEGKSVGPLATGYSVTSDLLTTGDNFSPTVPTAGTAVSSDNSRGKNRLYRAKNGKPEAVPRVKFREIGSGNKEGKGLKALPEALLVYTEAGLFVVTGETDDLAGDLFTYDERDPTLDLLAPNALVALDNTACALTSQGAVRSTGGGSAVFSRQIEPDLLRLIEFDEMPEFTSGCSYETERKFLLFTKARNAETFPTIVYTWNYLTNLWTRWRKPLTCGWVLSTNKTLYVAHARTARILQERKSRNANAEDFQDETVAISITAVATTVDAQGNTVSLLTASYSYTPEAMRAGFLIEQGFYEDRVTAVTSLGGGSYQLTMRRNLSTWQVAAAEASVPIRCELQYAPETAGNVNTMKLFTVYQVYLERNQAFRGRVGFLSDAKQSREYSDDIVLVPNRGWGSSPWGSSPWGDAIEGSSNPIRVFVPTEHQRCRALYCFFLHEVAKETFAILQTSLDTEVYSTRTTMEPR